MKMKLKVGETIQIKILDEEFDPTDPAIEYVEIVEQVGNMFVAVPEAEPEDGPFDIGVLINGTWYRAFTIVQEEDGSLKTGAGVPVENVTEQSTIIMPANTPLKTD